MADPRPEDRAGSTCGEPGAVRIACRVRRAARGIGPGVIPTPRLGSTPHLSVVVASALGRAQARSQADLYRPGRDSSSGGFRRSRRSLAQVGNLLMETETPLSRQTQATCRGARRAQLLRTSGATTALQIVSVDVLRAVASIGRAGRELPASQKLIPPVGSGLPLLQVSIQGGSADADDFGDVGQVHSVSPHPLCLGEFRRRHLRRSASGSTSRFDGGEADLSPFTDWISFELGEGAEDGKDRYSTLPQGCISPARSEVEESRTRVDNLGSNNLLILSFRQRSSFQAAHQMTRIAEMMQPRTTVVSTVMLSI